MKICITGVGICCLNIEDVAHLSELSIHKRPMVSAGLDVESYLKAERLPFKSKHLISREDRGILGEQAKLALDVSVQAMRMSQMISSYSKDELEHFSVYTAEETGGDRLTLSLKTLDQFVKAHKHAPHLAKKNMSVVKKFLHPLDMLRLLGTNSLYILSKVFQLRGGGVPIQRLSLSSMCALKTACLEVGDKKTKALVATVGNMRNLFSMLVFQRMNSLRVGDSDTGIIPSEGAAAVVVEPLLVAQQQKKNIFAEIIAIKTLFEVRFNIQCSDWLCLFKQLGIYDLGEGENLNIVYYNNGVKTLFKEEERAVKIRFPKARAFYYKPIIGYTGKANNLIDMVLALSDKRIPNEQYVLINGIGAGVGLGCILLRKMMHVS